MIRAAVMAINGGPLMTVASRHKAFSGKGYSLIQPANWLLPVMTIGLPLLRMTRRINASLFITRCRNILIQKKEKRLLPLTTLLIDIEALASFKIAGENFDEAIGHNFWGFH